MAKRSKLPKSWTTVTPLSKGIALSLFILLPVIAFHLGRTYQQGITPMACSNFTK